MVAAAAAIAVLWPATAACAAPPQDDYDEVISALGVAPQPSDYVVIVDTSGSMANAGRYAKVRTALSQLSSVLLPKDYVALLTFDQTAVVRYQGLVGKDPDKIVASLPAVPQGQGTDIGAGIAAGLDQLERKGALEVGAIVLITDGGLAAPRQSPYREAGSEAWQLLRQRAAQLAEGHRIAPYAVALDDSSDAKLLKDVFTGVIDVASNQVEKRLARIDSDLVNVQAAKVLEKDLAAEITTSWSAPMTELPRGGGTRTIEVTIASPMKHVPIVLTDLGVSADPLGAAATGFPDTIELKPGDSVTLPLDVSWNGSGNAYLSLTAQVSSPWQDVITKRLGATFEPRIAGATPMTTAAPFDWGPYLPYLWGGGLAALLSFTAWFAWRITRPLLVGSLAFTRNGAVVDEVLLDGRKVSIGPRGSGAGTGLSGSVHAVRRRANAGEGEPGVQVSLKASGKKTTVRLFDGESSSINDVQVTYTSVRTRMMSMINDHSS